MSPNEKRAVELIAARLEEHMTRDDHGELVPFGKNGHTYAECLEYAIEECLQNDEIELKAV